MTRILVTGMSGAGKSTLLEELRRRGHDTVDTDYDGWTLPDGSWDEERVPRLLAEPHNVVVSGTVENQVNFYNRFDHVILLSAPLDILLERVRTRRSNPYGQSVSQQAEIRHYVETVEPLLRRGATIELDGTRTPQDLADEVEQLIDGTE
ncbi:AAA family ATPase [Kocuria carniphila]|uniref:AAA family ATPase n=1 Tax=Kocuria carniphila TaxID=262208 RepID=UPI000DB4074B|nr:AAA family ATPase [Kocuria carniphila]MCT1804062.1 AAA family ATPase [Kocuria carniphila]PZP35304.1 MAG: ATP-binding protein [Kocuria rhizophila]